VNRIVFYYLSFQVVTASHQPGTLISVPVFLLGT